MVSESRYWVSFKREFSAPLSRDTVEAIAEYFGQVAEALRDVPFLEASSVSLSDHGGITLSGVVRSVDQVGALAVAERAFVAGLMAAGTVPEIPDPPHGPKWRAHELLGTAVPSVKLLTAA